jgi:predicted metal-dependent hydrolase
MTNTDNEHIEVAGIDIEIVRKDIKNMHLAVYPPLGRVRIATPDRMQSDSLRLFAISKLHWIKKQQAKFRAQLRETPRTYQTGESHYFKGKRYLLKVTHTSTKSDVKVGSKKILELMVPEHYDIQQREEVLREWHRKQLKEAVPALLQKWEPKLGVKVDGWGVKQMRTKWGTCSVDSKRIWLNLELSKKPENCLEYIVVHELVHLLERTHNERFVTYMDEFLPNWRLLRDQLNALPVRHEGWTY